MPLYQQQYETGSTTATSVTGASSGFSGNKKRRMRWPVASVVDYTATANANAGTGAARGELGALNDPVSGQGAYGGRVGTNPDAGEWSPLLLLHPDGEGAWGANNVDAAMAGMHPGTNSGTGGSGVLRSRGAPTSTSRARARLHGGDSASNIYSESLSSDTSEGSTAREQLVRYPYIPWVPVKACTPNSLLDVMSAKTRVYYPIKHAEMRMRGTGAEDNEAQQASAQQTLEDEAEEEAVAAAAGGKVFAFDPIRDIMETRTSFKHSRSMATARAIAARSAIKVGYCEFLRGSTPDPPSGNRKGNWPTRRGAQPGDESSGESGPRRHRRRAGERGVRRQAWDDPQSAQASSRTG